MPTITYVNKANPTIIWFGAFLLTTASVRTVRASAQIRDDNSDIAALVLGCGLLGFLLHNSIDFAIFHPGVGTYFFATLALALSLRQQGEPASLIEIGKTKFVRPTLALAGLLIVIGLGILKKEIPKMVEAWHTSKAYSISMIATYVIAVTYSLEVAVFVGVALSLTLYVYFSARDVKLVLLEPLGDGIYVARPVPKEFPSDEVTLLQSRGSMYFAAVHTLQDELPSWENTRHAVVILNMYGRSMVSTNLIDLVLSMHQEMMERDIKLMLSDVVPGIMDQFERTGLLDELGRDYVFPARDVIGASITEALEVGNAWLEEEKDGKDEK